MLSNIVVGSLSNTLDAAQSDIAAEVHSDIAVDKVINEKLDQKSE